MFLAKRPTIRKIKNNDTAILWYQLNPWSVFSYKCKCVYLFSLLAPSEQVCYYRLCSLLQWSRGLVFYCFFLVLLLVSLECSLYHLWIPVFGLEDLYFVVLSTCPSSSLTMSSSGSGLPFCGSNEFSLPTAACIWSRRSRSRYGCRAICRWLISCTSLNATSGLPALKWCSIKIAYASPIRMA